MSTKKDRERWAKQKLERTKQYLTVGWDGEAANDYFLNKCEPYPEKKYWGKPDTEPFINLRILHLADNYINGIIAPSAYIKEELINKLQSIISNDLIEPGKEKYCEYKKSVAKEILSNIIKGVYSFQHN